MFSSLFLFLFNKKLDLGREIQQLMTLAVFGLGLFYECITYHMAGVLNFLPSSVSAVQCVSVIE